MEPKYSCGYGAMVGTTDASHFATITNVTGANFVIYDLSSSTVIKCTLKHAHTRAHTHTHTHTHTHLTEVVHTSRKIHKFSDVSTSLTSATFIIIII